MNYIKILNKAAQSTKVKVHYCWKDGEDVYITLLKTPLPNAEVIQAVTNIKNKAHNLFYGANVRIDTL